MQTRRTTAAVGAVFTALVLAAGSTASHTPGGGPKKKDLVEGSGAWIEGVSGTTSLSISAKSKPNGDVKGQATYTQPSNPQENREIDITCMILTPTGFGTNATLGGVVVGGFYDGTGVVIVIEDNGEPVNGQSPDLIRVIAVPEPTFECDESFPPLHPLESGDFTVHDGA